MYSCSKVFLFLMGVYNSTPHDCLSIKYIIYIQIYCIGNTQLYYTRILVFTQIRKS